jgi:hypothetical protein
MWFTVVNHGTGTIKVDSVPGELAGSKAAGSAAEKVRYEQRRSVAGSSALLG